MLCVFVSCNGGKNETPVTPPVNFPLSRPFIGYGVITVSYTHVMESPGEDGVSTGYLRRGSVVSILERKNIRREAQTEAWVLAEGTASGWLRVNVMDIYDNELRAKTASESMTQ